MTEPRRCFFILVDQFHPDQGYIPSLVVENEAGHSPMVGQGEHSQPWFWGKDYDVAKQICAEANQRTFGLSPAEASDIVASSMAAGHRQDATAASHRVELAEKLGRRPNPADQFLANRTEGR
jgi:hypothetical protein